MPKTDDAIKLQKWAAINLEESIISTVQEEAPDYSQGTQMKALFNLTDSNKILAESNRTMAEANKQLVQNNTSLATAITGGAGTGNDLNVLATVQALQEFVLEAYSKRYNVSLEEAAALLGKKMVEKRKKLSKKGTPGGSDK